MMQKNEIAGMFDGSVHRVTLRIAAPILLANVLQFGYALADTFFISRIDPSSTAILSGTGMIFPLFFFFMSIGFSVSVGLSALVGRVVGEQNKDAARHVMASGWVLVWTIAGLSLIVGYGLGDPLVRLLAGSKLSEEALAYGLRFFRFLLPGLALMLSGTVFMGILQGEGLTGPIARAMALSTVINIALDPLCIFTLKLGVAGAGVATTIAILVSFIYVTTVFFRGHSSIPLTFDPRRASLKIIREIVRVGFPHFLSMASLSMSFMLLNKLVGSIGEASMNAWTLVGRMDQLVLIPSFAVSGATIAMIAQNYGRNRLDRIKIIYRTNILMSLLMVGACAVLYNLMASRFFHAFSSVPEVVAAATLQVRILSFTFLGVSVAIVSSATFQATGRPIPALGLTLFRMGIVAIPCAFLLVKLCHMGIEGVFIGVGSSNVLILPLTYAWTIHHLGNLRFKSVV